MKKINKMKQNLRDLWDKTKRSNICVNRVPEGEEKKYEIEKLLEVIMAKMVPIWQKTNTDSRSLVNRIYSNL